MIRALSNHRLLLGIGLAGLLAFACAFSSSSAAQRPQGRVLATWLPSWDGTHGLDTVLAHSASFRYVSPFSYQVTSLTTFSGSGGMLDPAQRAALRSKDIAVVPSVTAGWGPTDALLIFNSPAKRDAHVAAIVKLVTDNGLDGIDVDYEKMAYTTNPVVGQRLRTGFTAFATELCGKLRSMHKRCTITVMAKTADGHTTTGIDRWVFDYAALGRVASRVRLMVYDQHGPWGAPGPIADIRWTEDVVRYATSAIAPAKVELGVPLYGYNWSTKGTTSVQWDQASALRIAHNAPLVFDAASQSPHFSYRGGGVKHTVWFENARSLEAKVAVANRYHVGTIGFWYIGHQSPRVWPVLRRFNG